MVYINKYFNFKKLSIGCNQAVKNWISLHGSKNWITRKIERFMYQSPFMNAANGTLGLFQYTIVKISRYSKQKKKLRS